MTTLGDVAPGTLVRLFDESLAVVFDIIRIDNAEYIVELFQTQTFLFSDGREHGLPRWFSLPSETKCEIVLGPVPVFNAVLKAVEEETACHRLKRS